LRALRATSSAACACVQVCDVCVCVCVHIYCVLSSPPIHTYIHTYIHVYKLRYIMHYMHTLCMYMYICIYVYISIYINRYIYSLSLSLALSVCVCARVCVSECVQTALDGREAQRDDRFAVLDLRGVGRVGRAREQQKLPPPSRQACRARPQRGALRQPVCVYKHRRTYIHILSPFPCSRARSSPPLRPESSCTPSGNARRGRMSVAFVDSVKWPLWIIYNYKCVQKV
jgi:hypothetical protein